MSYDVSLTNKKGEIAEVESFEEGGTYVMGGSDEAELNVTYNYSKHFSVKILLSGKKAKDSIKILEKAVKKFGIERDNDYWNPTKGNVGYMCNILLNWAKQNPDYYWEID